MLPSQVDSHPFVEKALELRQVSATVTIVKIIIESGSPIKRQTFKIRFQVEDEVLHKFPFYHGPEMSPRDL